VVAKGILTPSGGPAPASGEVRVALGQASGGDVGALDKVDGGDQSQDGDIVVEGAGVEFGVDGDNGDVAFDMRVEFNVVVNVPFTKTDPKVVTGVAGRYKIFSHILSCSRLNKRKTYSQCLK